MSWAKIDDKFHSHPKVVAIAKKSDPLGAWVRMMTWCCDHGTDGRVPRRVALTFANSLSIAKLIEVRLLDEDGPDLLVHDFLTYNRPGDEQRASRSAHSEKRREAGKKGAASRWGQRDGAADDGKQDGKVPSATDGKTDGNCHLPSWHDDGPDPDPDPVEDNNNNRAGVRDPAPELRPWSADWCAAEVLAAASEDPLFDDGDLSALERPLVSIAKRLAALAPEHRFVDLRAEAAAWFIHARGRATEAADRGQPWSRQRTLTEVESKVSQRLQHRPKDARVERELARQEQHSRPQRRDIFDRPVESEPDIDLDDEYAFPRQPRMAP